MASVIEEGFTWTMTVHDWGWKRWIWYRIQTVYQVEVNCGKSWETHAEKTEGCPERKFCGRGKKKNHCKNSLYDPSSTFSSSVSVNFASGCHCQLAHLLCWKPFTKLRLRNLGFHNWYQQTFCVTLYRFAIFDNFFCICILLRHFPARDQQVRFC